MYTENQRERFMSLFVDERTPSGASQFLEIERRISHISSSDPDLSAFWEILADDIVNANTTGGLRYGSDGKECIMTDINIGVLERLVDKNFEAVDFYVAFLAFVKHQKKHCVDKLAAFIRQTCTQEEPMDEIWFNAVCVTPFKNAFSGFYPQIKLLMETVPHAEIIPSLCDALDAYYQTESYEEQSEVMSRVLQKYPESMIANTFLAFTYYHDKRWGPAIACFEKLETTGVSCFFYGDILFCMGWAYSKLREHKNAVGAYTRALEIDPKTPFALNNLGYEYYLLKQYSKALEIFRQCIDSEEDLRFAANNYIRTLLAMKRYADAKAFAKNPPVKLIPSLLRRVEAAEDKNFNAPSDLKEQTSGEENPEDEAEMEEELEQARDETASHESSPAAINRQHLKDGQFSSEKLLEDELTRRLETGTRTFGKNLKIYRRHGEYGRQYIIPIGRLDLLAEDDNGNLFVIELKKDGGYDDAYAQIVNYIRWFEKHKQRKDISVRGILCVNNPPKRLVEAVRKDDRIQLFHYQISYEEIK